jgi:hypothetical protein
MAIEERETQVDDQEQKFLEAAGHVDRGEDIPANLVSVPTEPTVEVETEANVPTAEELADPANKDRPRDPVSGKFIKKPAETAPVAAPSEAVKPPAAAPESEYAVAQRTKKEKETARLEKTWENVNLQKEELERRREELQRYEQSLRQPQQQRQQIQPRQFSSQDLAQAAEDFKANAKKALADGDYDTFNEQNALAEQAFQNAGQFYQLEQQEAQQIAMEQHNQTWVANMNSAIKENPDLGKPDAPIAVEMMDLLKTHGPIFQMIPDGFKQAVVIAQLRLDAKDAPTLRERVKALEAAKAEQDKLLAPTPGGVTAHVAPKKVEEMSESDLLAAAQRMDES